MIIISIMGGLGNQMQQCALYRKLLRCGADKDIKLDISWFDGPMEPSREFELPLFEEIPLPICTTEEKNEIIRESKISNLAGKVIPTFRSHFVENKMHHTEIYRLKNVYIDGYFACEMYYDDILDELTEVFKFPENPDSDINEKNKELMGEMDYSDSVSVHIRRGSYIQLEGGEESVWRNSYG